MSDQAVSDLALSSSFSHFLPSFFDRCLLDAFRSLPN